MSPTDQSKDVEILLDHFHCGWLGIEICNELKKNRMK